MSDSVILQAINSAALQKDSAADQADFQAAAAAMAALPMTAVIQALLLQTKMAAVSLGFQEAVIQAQKAQGCRDAEPSLRIDLHQAREGN
jgi:hypothetical protein